MDNVFFNIGNNIFGYDGVLVFKTNEKWEDEIIASFENIILKKITKKYAIFYFPMLNQYLKFDGETFSEFFSEKKNDRFDDLNYEIVYKYDDEYSQKMDVEYPQIRFIVNGNDLINKVNKEYSFHYGIDFDRFIEQEEKIFSGRLLIGLCGCTCEGCDDVIATIGSYKNSIYWDVHIEVGGGPIKSQHKYFKFEINKYKSIMNEIINKIIEKPNGI